MPLLFISVLLLAHNLLPSHTVIIDNEKKYGLHLIIPFRDVLIMGLMYVIAIWYRRDINITARAMFATGIVFIVPALVRLIHYAFIPRDPWVSLCTLLIVYCLLIGLIIKESKQQRGRWVFQLVPGPYIVVHSIMIFQVQFDYWESFSKWFAGLPLI